MRRSISARAGDGAFGGRAILAADFGRAAAFFFAAGTRLRVAAFFATGRFGAFLLFAFFAAERRDAEFVFAAMVPLLKPSQVYPPISLTAICYLGLGCRP